MIPIFLSFIGFIIILILMGRLTSHFLGRFVGKMIADKFKAAEEIINTVKAPREWTDPYERKIENARNNSKRPKKLEKMEKRAKGRILKNMENLMKYLTKAPRFDRDETKKFLLDEIQKVKNQWESGPWKNILKNDK